MYADDTVVLFSHSYNSVIECTLNDERTIVKTWLDKYKLTLNVKIKKSIWSMVLIRS